MIIQTRGLSQRYSSPAGTLQALAPLDLEIPAGQFVAVVGKSGSGKSTLLHLLGGIDRPSAGQVEVAGARLEKLDEKSLAPWRGRHVGFVFQFFQLIPTLTVLENVLLPMDFADVIPPRQREERALALLARVEVADQAEKLPATLSGGQQQRVAIARALANDPPLLLADEPTGNLDSATARAILSLFRELADGGKTVVIATHERELATVDRTIELVDGHLREAQP